MRGILREFRGNRRDLKRKKSVGEELREEKEGNKMLSERNYIVQKLYPEKLKDEKSCTGSNSYSVSMFLFSFLPTENNAS